MRLAYGKRSYRMPRVSAGIILDYTLMLFMDSRLPRTNEQRILEVIRHIPFGAVTSYGIVAAKAGLPRRARLVGMVLRNNTDPDLPWHRVMGAGGKIVFPDQSEAASRQRQKLTAEGVQFIGTRVDLSRFDWREADLPLLPAEPADHAD